MSPIDFDSPYTAYFFFLVSDFTLLKKEYSHEGVGGLRRPPLDLNRPIEVESSQTEGIEYGI
jgi:hypothetical protein